MTQSPRTSNLSPHATPFQPTSKVKTTTFDIQHALSVSSSFLSSLEFSLLSDIVNEWQCLHTLASCISHWKSFIPTQLRPKPPPLQVLLFNVRGIDERWEEVLLLLEKYKPDALVLVEVGSFDPLLIPKIFVNHRCFYQKGENSWGGVFVISRNNLKVTRVPVQTPNVCAVDIHLHLTFRLIGLYAPTSKTWDWSSITPLITGQCCILGDFNIDISAKRDESKAKDLLDWADSAKLIFLPLTVPLPSGQIAQLTTPSQEEYKV